MPWPGENTAHTVTNHDGSHARLVIGLPRSEKHFQREWIYLAYTYLQRRYGDTEGIAHVSKHGESRGPVLPSAHGPEDEDVTPASPRSAHVVHVTEYAKK